MKLSENEEEKELTSTAAGQSKKLAAQGCALLMLSQLYKLSLVEASSPTAAGPKKKQQRMNRVSDSDSFNDLTICFTHLLYVEYRS